MTIIQQRLAVGLGYFRLMEIEHRNWLEIMAILCSGKSQRTRTCIITAWIL
jgi:hypothetical protein